MRVGYFVNGSLTRLSSSLHPVNLWPPRLRADTHSNWRSSNYCGFRRTSSGKPMTAVDSMRSQLLVQQLHSTKTQLVLFLTGGGSQAISDMLIVPGASATVLEARVPYATDATQELLGQKVASLCSQECAVLLARKAFQRAAHLTSPGTPILGLSCTAALRTVRDKQGEHRMHIACHTGTSTAIYNITLEKNARSRAAEEAVCSAAVLSIAAFHCGVAPAEIPDWPSLPGTTAIDSVQRTTEDLGDPVQALLHGRVQCVEISGPPGDRTAVVDAPRAGACILPGSFNPLHDGHKELLAAAHRADGNERPCMFELCIRNADKGTISAEEISQRLVAFEEQGLPIVLTNAPLFTGKARLFKGARFVLGYDTAVRIVMPKYYGDSEARMAADFAELHAAECSFVVGGRVDSETGRFLGLESIQIPNVLQHVGIEFQGVAEHDFRLDISSTELRRAAECNTVR